MKIKRSVFATKWQRRDTTRVFVSPPSIIVPLCIRAEMARLVASLAESQWKETPKSYWTATGRLSPSPLPVPHRGLPVWALSLCNTLAGLVYCIVSTGFCHAVCVRACVRSGGVVSLRHIQLRCRRVFECPCVCRCVGPRAFPRFSRCSC